MNLLGAALYDPSVAVSKATSSLLAMTAFDTTNLRVTVTVPTHGMVFVRIRCALTGATSMPAILLGTLVGSTVTGRVTPLLQSDTVNGATRNIAAVAEFTVTGLTPGSTNFDAAYAVQLVIANTNIKYGGPNDASGTDAWGGFLFEIWDPQPTSAYADGLLDRSAGIETNITPRQGLRLILAALAGKVSGAASNTVTIRDTNDTKNRIIAVVDSSGDRSSLTYDLTSPNDAPRILAKTSGFA